MRCHLLQADAPKLSSPLPVGLCVWCVYVSVCASTCTRMFTEARGGGCSQSLSINRSPSSALRQSPFMNLELTILMRLTGQKALGSSCLKICTSGPRFLHGCWGCELRSSSLHKKHFNKGAISSASPHSGGWHPGPPSRAFVLCGAAMWVYKL